MPPAKLHTLIVDDEDLARRILREYVSKVPALSLAGECPDGIAALDFLRCHPVDLLLLDINMPELSGMDLLASLHRPPRVILTTAHSEFALEGYEYGVVDYLLKPIAFPRFLKATQRALGEAAPAIETAPSGPPPLDFLEVKVDGITRNIPIKGLLYVKSFGNYLRLVTDAKTYTLLGTLTGLEERLPPGIQRVHKSYILNLAAATGLVGNRIRIGEREILLSPLYKLLVLEKLKDG